MADDNPRTSKREGLPIVTSSVSDKWWHIILLQAGVPILSLFYGLILGLLGRGIEVFFSRPSAISAFRFGIGLVKIAVVLLMIVSPVAVYFDRKYVRKQSEWNPSAFYYLIFFGPIGWGVAALYLYNRRKYVNRK